MTAIDDSYRRQLEAVTANATLALFIMDEHQRCTYMNRAAEEMTGFSLAELQGKALHDYIHHTRPDGSPYPLEECPIDQAFPQNMREKGEEVFVHKDGHFYPVAFTASPIRQNGRTVGTIIEVREITGERQAGRRAAFLEALGQALQRVTDPGEEVATAARMLGEHLGVDRCAYAEVEADEDHFILWGDYTRGDTASIVGRYAMSAFGAEALRLMRVDEPYVVDDVLADPRVGPDDRAAYEQTQIRAVISMPLHKAGRFVAGMGLHQRTPRHWLAEEVQLVRTVTQRLWESIERARALRELQESEQRFRLMADAVPQIMWITDAEGRVEFFNRQWTRYTGKPYEPTTAAEVAGSAVHPDDGAITIERFDEARRTGRGFQVEHRIRSASGEYRWFLVRAEPHRDPETGNIVRWFGSSVDIHDRRLAEERASRLQSLTTALAAAVSVEEVAEVVIAQGAAAANAATAALSIRAVGDDTAGIVAQTGLDEETERAGGSFPLDGSGPGAVCMRTGAPIFVEARGGPEGLLARFPGIPDVWERLGTHAVATVPLPVAGETIGAISFTFAAPRRFSPEDREFFLAVGRQAAQALERARLLSAEREARASADQANRAKSQFLATMSHELRTPLNAIGGYAELIEMGIHGPITEAQKGALERIQRAQRQLLGLINGVLNYVKVDAGAVGYEITEVALHEVLATCAALVTPQAGKKDVVLHYDPPADTIRVLGDREKVQQVVLNLLSNAVKFTDPGGHVSLECSPGAGGTIAVRVTDTGRGIAPDQQERVFQPFVQLDAALTREQEGTGLGLAISRDLARGMGGDLSVRSRVGEGSEFTLTLPAP